MRTAVRAPSARCRPRRAAALRARSTAPRSPCRDRRRARPAPRRARAESVPDGARERAGPRGGGSEPGGGSRARTTPPAPPPRRRPRATAGRGMWPGRPRSRAWPSSRWFAGASPPRPRSDTGRGCVSRAGRGDDAGTSRGAAGGEGQPASCLRSGERIGDPAAVALVDALDVGADAAQLLVDAVVAAVEVVDAVDHRLAAGGEGGEEQARGGP